MEEGLNEGRWVFVVRVQDAPGALTAIASVFSSRGVSLETILGNGVPLSTVSGAIVLSFRAALRKKMMLLRIVRRLEKVTEVRDYAYESPELRAVAVARLTANTPTPSPFPGRIETLSEDNSGRVLLLNGSAEQVDNVLTGLRAQGALGDVMVSVLPV